jgi:phosphoglycolate phosphatase-like HAD superfamily hydrolase
MTVLFDLDYTLYDTLAIKREIIRALTELGYPLASVEETFPEANLKTPAGVGYYVPERHAAFLTSRHTSIASEKRVAECIHACPENGERFLYPGAAGLLTDLRSQGHHLVLLTLGDDRWQRAKAVGAGLDDLCERIVTTTEDKEHFIRDFKGEDPRVIIVNDNVPEMVRMRDAVPEYYYLVKRGPKGIPDDCDFPVADTMEDLERLITAGLAS